MENAKSPYFRISADEKVYLYLFSGSSVSQYRLLSFFLAMDQEIFEEGITVLCENTVFLMDLYSSLLMYLL